MEFEKELDSLFVMNKDSNNQPQEVGKEPYVVESGNGSKKYSTSGDPFVDNFASISYFKELRTYAKVAEDMEKLWEIDSLKCLKLAVYIRLITRRSKIVTEDGVEIFDVQRGQGLKNEGILRLLWLFVHHPNTFKANIHYFIASGSWKDIFQLLSIDLRYNGWEKRMLDWNFIYLVISAGLSNPDSTHLVRKYLPTIKNNKECTTLDTQAKTLIGRWIARRMFPNKSKEISYKQYRKLKSSGNAHGWQQLISKQLYDYLKFDKIPGRALAILVGSKFLANHNLLAKYSEWIKTKKEVKYTGFVFEIFKALGDTSVAHHVESHLEDTINAQFQGLVNLGKENASPLSNILVVRDTSGSMNSTAKGCNMSSFGIGKAMALYFSEFLTGYFKGKYAEFRDECILHEWVGDTPCDKWVSDRSACYGNTNFITVIDLLIKLKESGVSESEFPTGILCISDGEFDSVGNNDSSVFKFALSRLRGAKFSDHYVDNLKLILWDIPNSYYGARNGVKFEDFADAPNFFYMSGYDPAAVEFIFGSRDFKASPRNAKELMEAALSQDLLNRLVVL